MAADTERQLGIGQPASGPRFWGTRRFRASCPDWGSVVARTLAKTHPLVRVHRDLGRARSKRRPSTRRSEPGQQLSESYDLGEDGTQGRGAMMADALLDASFEPGDLTGRERSEPVSSAREVDARGAGIVEVGPPFHEPGAFDGTNHRRHRLLREM